MVRQRNREPQVRRRTWPRLLVVLVGIAGSAHGTTEGAPLPTRSPAVVKLKDRLPARPELERRARVAVLGRDVGDLALVGDMPRFAFALEDLRDTGRRQLLLFDLTADPALIVGEHDFGGAPTPDGSAARRDPENGQAPGDEGAEGEAERSRLPARIIGTLEVVSDSGEPVVLAEVETGEGVAACGWWLRRRGTRFLCAPRTGRASRYQTVEGLLAETWEADLPALGGGPLVSPASGRLFRVYGGQWREVDRFQCLAWSLSEAVREAGAQGLAVWQEAAVRQRIAAARRESAALDTDRSIAMLEEAIAIEGCDAAAWRLLGRLEFERGRAADAAPRLAVALVLERGNPAAVVDLADAVLVLNTAPQAGQDALRSTIQVLEGSPSTRRIVDEARRAHGVPTARALARTLYEAYLERTPEDDPRLESTRRRAAEQVEALGSAMRPQRGRRPEPRPDG